VGLLAAGLEGFDGKAAGRPLRIGGLGFTPSCSRDSIKERISISSDRNAVCRLTLGAETEEEVDRSPCRTFCCLELETV
jgi:hypothetical protein